MGGIYFSGGVISRFAASFATSGCREKFESKGRFRNDLEPILVYLVTRANLGLLGARKKRHLRRGLS
jgi:glucokinase